jgi:hypothetical protein
VTGELTKRCANGMTPTASCESEEIADALLMADTEIMTDISSEAPTFGTAILLNARAVDEVPASVSEQGGGSSD